MIRVGAVGQNQRPGSEGASLEIRVDTAQPFVPRQRVAVEMNPAVRPPAA